MDEKDKQPQKSAGLVQPGPQGQGGQEVPEWLRPDAGPAQDDQSAQQAAPPPAPAAPAAEQPAQPGQPASQKTGAARRSEQRLSLNILVERFDMTGFKMLERGKFADLATGGALFSGNEELPPKTKFKFKFDVQGEYMMLTGETIRSRKDKTDGRWLCGIKFNLTGLQQERFGRLVAYARRGERAPRTWEYI